MDNSELNTTDEELSFEMTPEQAVSLKGDSLPSRFNRKKVMIFISTGLAALVIIGMIINVSSSSVKKTQDENEFSSADNSSGFLASLRDSAIRRDQAAKLEETPQQPPENAPEPSLPPVVFNSSPNTGYPTPTPQPYSQTPLSGASSGGVQPSPPPHYRSSIMPPVEGRLFSANVRDPPAPPAPGRSAMDDYYSALAASRTQNPAYGGVQPSLYDLQNNQQNKQSFYGSSSGSSFQTGRFLGENSLWPGTIIPGVLLTAVNTDLPGIVLARVTQNIYDSQTGRNLMVPQGSLLIARYNSSVSYAQHRVQIVWDTIIRPDGFQLDLDGAPAVDKSGMSGQDANYSENWFEYIKAAGIITMFSIANARMTETAAQYTTDASAGNLAAANSDFVNQTGGNLIARAMNIQPTLTVDNGTIVNILINKPLYLPPADGVPVTKKYFLE
jgi:type IV secretory pathway VirB10-like protein